MDLVFKRYSSPFIFLDQLIEVGRFSEFVSELFEINEEDKLWELYLSMFLKEQSFNDFKKLIIKENQTMSQSDIEATVKQSKNILDNFNPN